MNRSRAGLLQWLARSGFANLIVRMATLGFRFTLSFYVVSVLGLETAGIFGLASGTIAIVPAAIGWGLNYHVSREVVGSTPVDAAPVVRDRLVVTALSLSAFTILGVAAMVLWVPSTLWFAYSLIIALTWFETIGLDLQMPLIGMNMAFEATLIQFVRTAAWIPFLVALAMLVPALRSLQALFLAWILFGVVSLIVLAVILRRWPIAATLHSPIRIGWAVQRMRQNWYIYLSDLGIVGFTFVDRYIVSFMLTLTATGIYSFYWSITNALQTLILSAIVQPALPRFVSLFRASDIAGWRHAIRNELLKTLAISMVLGAGIIVMTWGIIHFSPPGRFPDDMPLLFVMMGASVARASSDLLNVGITSTGRDRSYAATNFLGMIVTIILCLIVARPFGLIGIGTVALFCGLLLSAVRFFILRVAARHRAA